MRARIQSVSREAEGINAYQLEPLAGEHLPPFTAGAHISVRLANGIIRSYSLLNSSAQEDVYIIGVYKAPDSRGGSRFIHENWKTGDVVEISEPRNNFPLNEKAENTVFIAGGIGITPILSMIYRLEQLRRPWKLHYGCSTAARAAFLDRIAKFDPARVEIVFDDNPSGKRLDMAAAIAAAPADAHIYCCGPSGMLAAFESLMKARPSDYCHLEYFSSDTEAATSGGFVIELSRSGISIPVEEGETILDALLGAGVNIGFACAEGVCGTCKVGVLSGVPDHRDRFLTDAEKDTNQVMMVCCSGSKTSSLVLDI